MSSKRAANLLLMGGLLALSACGPQNPAGITVPDSSAPVAVTPKASLGVYQLSLTGQGRTITQASVGRVGGLQAQAAETTGLSFKSNNYGYYTDQATGTLRMWATFDVTNNTGQDLKAPTLVPVDTDGAGGTIGTTAFKNVKYFDGSDASSRAPLLNFDESNDPKTTVKSPLVRDLDSASIEVNLPAGMKLAGAAHSGWKMSTLPAGATGQVTLAASIPQGATPQENPFSFDLVFTVADAVPTVSLTNIGAIQGSTPSGDKGAALTGSQTVEGVVTYTSLDPAGKVNGFFVQEEGIDADRDDTTSDGVFVYCGTNCATTGVATGDRVRVTGTVSEFQNQTQLGGTLTVTKLASNVPLPVAAELKLPLPIAQRERYEGMRVHVQGVVNSNYQLGRGGLLDIADSRPVSYTQDHEPNVTGYAQYVADLADRTIRIDDGSLAENESSVEFARNGGPLSISNILRAGDQADVTGVMTYRYNGWTVPASDNVNTYRIYATPKEALFTGDPRPATPADVMGGGAANARVASMNVENFFTTMQKDNSGCTPNGVDSTARGPVNCDEYARKLDKMVNVVSGLNGDVIGLNELQNYGKYGVEKKPSVQLLVEELNRRLGSEVYAAVLPGRTIGTDVIAVGYIYKKAAFTPVGQLGVLDNTFNTRYTDTCNRPTMAQTFQSNSNGGRFTLVIAHLKSKGSACSALGDSDQNDGQGNGYQARLNAASLIHSWLATDPTRTNEQDVIVMGDMNAYLAEPPVKAILNGPDGTAGSADDFISQFGPESYSYQFGGAFGSLDHAFASPSFASQIVGKTKWHINADENVLYKPDFEYKAVPGCATKVGTCNGPDLYSSGPFAASDHDPILLGVNLTAQTPLPTNPGTPTTPVTTLTASPAALTVTAGGAAVSSTLITSTQNYSGTDLAVTITTPAGLNVTPSATTVSPNGTFTVSVTAPEGTPAGTYPVTVTTTGDNGLKASTDLTVTVGTGGGTTPPTPTGSDLIFSEYVEGSSNNKALELYNPTSDTIDLSAYSVELYANGATTPNNTQKLSGTLAAGGTLVLVNGQAGATLKALGTVSSVTNFNGDDALVLKKGTTIIDSFGQVGLDPGNAWTANSVTTIDKTLRRKAGVTAGDANATDAFDPSAQWEQFDIDTFDGLGSR